MDMSWIIFMLRILNHKIGILQYHKNSDNNDRSHDNQLKNRSLHFVTKRPSAVAKPTSMLPCFHANARMHSHTGRN